MQKMLQFNQRSVLLGAEGGVSKGRAKYGKMENELKRSNQDYIDSTVQEQQVLSPLNSLHNCPPTYMYVPDC